MGYINVVCENCLHSGRLSNSNKAHFHCSSCGHNTETKIAISLGKLAFSFGQTVVNRGITCLFVEKSSNLKSSPAKAFPMRLSRGTTEVNLLVASKEIDASTLNVSTVAEVDFVSIPGCVSAEDVFKEGTHLLKIFRKKRAEQLRGVKTQFIDFNRIWINNILLATYKGEVVGRVRYPRFGYIIIQQLGYEYQNTEFILYPDDIDRPSHSCHPLLPDGNKYHLHDAVMEGSAQGFKEKYDIHILGDMDAELQKIGIVPNSKCRVLKVTVRKLPAVILIPEKRRVYIFHKFYK